MLTKAYLSLCLAGLTLSVAYAKEPDLNPAAVIQTYSEIAHATYADSLAAAKVLSQHIDTLIETPSEETLAAARQAWIRARVPYQQSEALRFGNPIVDQLDMKLNAWPVDESFIDYVNMGTQFGAPAPINLISNPQFQYNGVSIDAREITPTLLSESLHELGGNEAFVATGFHAIEFLLWGQDLNVSPKSSGQRPASDFSLDKCTHDACDRRIAFLRAVTDQLLTDLVTARDTWAVEGAARHSLAADTHTQALARMLNGLGSLAYGELAGERMKLGLLLQDQEEEHDCFSDNTHNSHYYNLIGIQNLYFGRYTNTEGEIVSGPSLYALVEQDDPELAKQAKLEFEKAHAALLALKQHAETVEPYDQMISHASAEGVATVEHGIESLIRLAKIIERSSDALNLNEINFEGSDSLDRPSRITE